MTPMQIKIAVYGGALLLAWLLRKRAAGSSASATDGAPVGRVTKTLDINADVYSPDFGTPYISGPGGPGGATPSPANANPAIDPAMRALIDKSNAAISADNADTTTVGLN